MRFPAFLRLFPLIAPPQSSPLLNTNVVSSSWLLSAPPVVLPLQLNSDQILTRPPASQAASSASPLLAVELDSNIFLRSIAPSLLDSPANGPPLSDGTSDVCQGLIEDLDITGLGVRMTFYVTSILTVINANVPGCNAKGSCWATLFTFIAIMIAAIVQAANRSISLYNANIVLYLCFLHLSCALTLIQGALIRRKLIGVPADINSIAKVRFCQVFRRIYKIDHSVMLMFLLSYWSWNGFGLYVWIHARSFGSQPECNSATKLIVLGRELSATGSGRVVSLVLFGINATVALSAPVVTTIFFGVLSVLCFTVMGPLIASFFRRLPDTGNYNPPHTSNKKIFLANLLLTLCFVIQWVYVVVTIEQTIQHNPVIHVGPRFPITFGQILPVVTIGACVVSIYNDWKESWKESGEKHKWSINTAEQLDDLKAQMKGDV